MTDKLRQQNWQGAIPEPSAAFHQAMTNALSQLESAPAPAKRKPLRRRTAAIILVAALLLAAVAVAAALAPNIFEVLLFHPVKNSEQYIVHDLAEAHYDHCDIAVKEAAYDGRSLYVLYSIRDRMVEHPLGEWDDQSGKRLLLDGDEASPGRTADQVGWWTDALWINGQDIGMPNLSSSQRYGSDVNGEVLYYDLWRLDEVDVFLSGKTEVSLPIGPAVPMEERTYNDQYALELPDSGVVTFTIDASDRSGITTYAQDTPVEIKDCEAWVSEASFTPIQVYVTLSYTIPEDMAQAYLAAHREEVFDDIRLARMDLVSTWLFQLALVDKDGAPVMEESLESFLNSEGDESAEFVLPTGDYPEELYLALPAEAGGYDMTHVLRVR